MITLWLDYQTANTVLLMLHNTCLLSRELMSNDNTLEYAFSLTAPEAHSPILIGATLFCNAGQQNIDIKVVGSCCQLTDLQ